MKIYFAHFSWVSVSGYKGESDRIENIHNSNPITFFEWIEEKRVAVETMNNAVAVLRNCKILFDPVLSGTLSERNDAE